eukprot:11468759-Heterocapsa_arctica.AAC.1
MLTLVDWNALKMHIPKVGLRVHWGASSTKSNCFSSVLAQMSFSQQYGSTSSPGCGGQRSACTGVSR